MKDNIKNFGDRRFHLQKAEDCAVSKNMFSIISDKFIDCQSKGMSEVASYMQALATVQI